MNTKSPIVLQTAHSGITEWDYFAAAALSGVVSDSEIVLAASQEVKGSEDNVSRVLARMAANIADAMMIERAERLSLERQP